MSFNVLGGAAEAGLGTWSPREAQGRGSRPDLPVRNPPVRKERGLRLRGPRGAEKTNAACFTDSQAHPVSTGLPPALCAGLLCQDGPLNARVSHQRSPYTTTAFPSEENKTKKQNKMQRFLFSSAEPGNERGGGIQCFAAQTSSHNVRIADIFTPTNLGSFFPGDLRLASPEKSPQQPVGR